MAWEHFGSLSFARTVDDAWQDHTLRVTVSVNATPTAASSLPTHNVAASALSSHSLADMASLTSIATPHELGMSMTHIDRGGDMATSGMSGGSTVGDGVLAFGLGAASLLTDHNLASIGMSHAAGAAMGVKLQMGLADLYVASEMNGLSKLSGAAAFDVIKAVTASNTLLQMYVEGADSHGRGGHVMVAVDFVAADGNGAGLLDALNALGLTHGGAYGAMAGGFIPVDQLDALAKMDALAFARPVYVSTNVGLTTNQGVVSQNVDHVQSDFGFNGTGIKIGMMSDSFDTRTTATTHYTQDVTNGDLPAGVQIIKDYTSPGTDEGRAMMQQAYDIAPNASFAFYTANISMADFANGITALNAAGCDIIVDDVRYYAESMFQDGIVAQAAANAVANGSMYFSSAGNSRDDAYMSAFRDSGTTVVNGGITYKMMDFDSGAGVDTKMRINQTATTIYDLQWSDPFKSTSPGSTGGISDLALFIYRTNGTLLGKVDVANVGLDPVEIAQLTGSGSFDIAIGVRSTTANPTLIKFDAMSQGTFTFNEYDSHSATAWGHNNAAGVIAVAASDWVDSARYGDFPVGSNPFPYAEEFTSKGGQQILFDTAGNLLASPLTRDNVKFTASDGGNTTFFGSDATYPSDPDTFPNFYGTSSAAPNAAAIAALLMQAFPAATNVQIQAAMAASALDITIDYLGNATGVGTDLTTGTGLIQADAALALLHSLFAPTVNNDAVATDEDTAIASGSVFADNGSGADTDPNNILFVTQVNGLAANVGGSITLASGAHLTVNHNGTFSYDPNHAFEGLTTGETDTDSFTYTLHGGGTATVTVTINGVDDATIANDDSFTTDEDTALSSGNVFADNGSGADTDVDSTPTVTAVNGSASDVGTQITLASGALLTLNADGTFAYDPNHAFDSLAAAANGSDSFTYTTVGGDTATVTITVTGVDDPAIANDDAFATDEDTALTSGNVLADNGSGADSDVDSTLAVTAVNGSASDVGTQITLASGALLTLNSDGTFSYDPNGQFEGLGAGDSDTDTFTYEVNGVTATATVTINGVDDATIANDDAFTTDEDTALTSGNVFADNGSGADSDVDSTLTVTEVNGSAADVGTQITLASGALLTLNADGTFSYDPNHAFESLPAGNNGSDSFTYTTVGGDTATVTLTITGVDDPGVANNDAFSTDEATALSSGSVFADNGSGADSDVDSTLTVASVNGSASDVGTQIVLASGALLTLNADGTFSYDPNHAFDGLGDAGSGASNTSATDSFTYALSDGSTATVTVTVNGVDSDDTLFSTAGDDTIEAGIGADTVWLQLGGDDSVMGEDGADTFRFGATFNSLDTVNGGNGNDKLLLRGDYSAGVTVGLGAMTSVEHIRVFAGFDYDLTILDDNIQPGRILYVTGAGLGAGDSLRFDASGEHDGRLNFKGGDGADTFLGGTKADKFDGGAGMDTFTGGKGADVFLFHAGEADGDTVTDFQGRHADKGDALVFEGYGAGATFTQIDAHHWAIDDGVVHEVITFTNNVHLDPTDFTFI